MIRNRFAGLVPARGSHTGPVPARGSRIGLVRTRDESTGLVRARDGQPLQTCIRRDSDVHLPRRHDMSMMTHDMARDRMRQMRRDMEVARGVHGRYAARQRPRRIA
jgi:hypothetical protein